MDIGKGVIVHGSAEVDGVEDFDAIPLALQELTALHDDGTFRIGYDKGTGILLRSALHQIGLNPKASFAAAGTADDQHIFVAGIRRIFRATRHHEPFRLGQDDVVLKHRVDIGLNILRRSP